MKKYNYIVIYIYTIFVLLLYANIINIYENIKLDISNINRIRYKYIY